MQPRKLYMNGHGKRKKYRN